MLLTKRLPPDQVFAEDLINNPEEDVGDEVKNGMEVLTKPICC
jgi:hypothetical protein